MGRGERVHKAHFPVHTAPELKVDTRHFLPWGFRRTQTIMLYNMAYWGRRKNGMESENPGTPVCSTQLLSSGSWSLLLALCFMSTETIL